MIAEVDRENRGKLSLCKSFFKRNILEAFLRFLVEQFLSQSYVILPLSFSSPSWAGQHQICDQVWLWCFVFQAPFLTTISCSWCWERRVQYWNCEFRFLRLSIKRINFGAKLSVLPSRNQTLNTSSWRRKFFLCQESGVKTVKVWFAFS